MWLWVCRVSEISGISTFFGLPLFRQVPQSLFWPFEKQFVTVNTVGA
jgi:hypothetical protein